MRTLSPCFRTASAMVRLPPVQARFWVVFRVKLQIHHYSPVALSRPQMHGRAQREYTWWGQGLGEGPILPFSAREIVYIKEKTRTLSRVKRDYAVCVFSHLFWHSGLLLLLTTFYKHLSQWIMVKNTNNLIIRYVFILLPYSILLKYITSI